MRSPSGSDLPPRRASPATSEPVLEPFNLGLEIFLPGEGGFELFLHDLAILGIGVSLLELFRERIDIAVTDAVFQ